MQTQTLIPLACGHALDLSPGAFGQMTDSTELLDDPRRLREQLDQEGYLYLRGVLHRQRVLDARRCILEALRDQNVLDPAAPLMDGVVLPDKRMAFRPDLAESNVALMDVLYSGAMIDIYQKILGQPVRHFDFTWLRAVSRGAGTPPHMDSVYMNRGTQRLFTSWTPLGDIPLEQGGLIVMPASHKIRKIRDHYGQKDVDTYCTNITPRKVDGFGGLTSNGWLSHNPVRLRAALGLPWLTRQQYHAGDVVIFSIYTIHCGLDNQTDRIRLSSDSRYQSADEPADERWISIGGNKPIGHTTAGKRGRIC